MQLNFYFNYVSPMVSAVLVTALNVLWSDVETPRFLFFSFFLVGAILVAFVLNRRKNDGFNGKLSFVLKRQGILLISTFFAMYVLEIVLSGIYFVGISMYSCGAPFCV